MHALLIDGRNAARSVPALQMRCDAREVPDPTDRAETVASYWIGMGGFLGETQLLRSDGSIEDVGRRGVKGAIAVAITQTRILGLVAPVDIAQPALWLDVNRGEYRVETRGSIGTFKKRPEVIQVRFGGEEDGFGLSDVMRLFRNSGKAQPWQEKALVEALTRA